MSVPSVLPSSPCQLECLPDRGAGGAAGSPTPAPSLAVQQGSPRQISGRVHWPGRKSCWQRVLSAQGQGGSGLQGLEPHENRAFIS